MKRPWFRRSNCTWYLESEHGKQIPLGKDERFKAPPKESPKEPPPAIQKKYLEAMQRQAEPEDRTLSFCVRQFLDYSSDTSRANRKRAERYLTDFLDVTGDIKVSTLKRHHLTSYLKANEAKGWKQNTRRDIMARIHACLNYCETEGWIVKNPLRGKLKLPAVQRREEVMSVEDRKKVLDASEGCFRAFLSALSETGCRPKELRTALIEKCDLEKGVLLVTNKTRNKTGVIERPVYLSRKMIELCRELIGDRTGGEIFLNSKGTPWTQTALEHRIQKLCAELGVTHGATLYSFRHGWASDAINRRNINPALVAVQLGHSDLKMLMKHYLETDAAEIRKQLDS